MIKVIFNRIRSLSFNQLFTFLLLTIMSIQIVPIEGWDVSFIKVALMGFCILVFLIKVPFLNKAFWLAGFYWMACFTTSFLHPNFRFSTLGYMALFLVAFIVYYNLIYIETFSLGQFQKILKFLILAYAIVLFAQQICVVMGIRNFPLINLVGLEYYQWNRLPSLSCEPSHSATILTALFLGYLRCIEIKDNCKPFIRELFNSEHRNVVLCYLWLTFTMGSGTGWVGFAIVCIYFIQWRTILSVVPLFIIGVFLLSYSGNEQFQRALVSFKATLTGNATIIGKADGSASTRIVPLVNTIMNLDLSDENTWIGKGTLTLEKRDSAWGDIKRKIPVIEQYGLIGFMCSLILIYACIIKNFFSSETLCFLLLQIMSIYSAYTTWSMLFVFLTIRYFQIQKQNELLRKVII